MKSYFLSKNIFVFIIVFLFHAQTVLLAQEDEKSNQKFKIRSFGLNVGVYNPELDYWKNDTNSVFRQADFSTNIFANGFVELTLVKNLAAKLGVGYWQTRAESVIPSYGKTSMLLTGNPISLDLVYYAEPIKLGFVTPYIGAGVEYLFIQYSLDFEDKDNPDPVNGSSALLSGLIGLELGFSDNFAMDLFAEYKHGQYDQRFVRQIISSDPDLPDAETEVTESISLNGPKFGISFKYRF